MWATVVVYIRMEKECLYLVAITNLHSEEVRKLNSIDFVARKRKDKEEIGFSWVARKQWYNKIIHEEIWRSHVFEAIYLWVYTDD